MLLLEIDRVKVRNKTATRNNYMKHVLKKKKKKKELKFPKDVRKESCNYNRRRFIFTNLLSQLFNRIDVRKRREEAVFRHFVNDD